jgi:hypothetical protein
MSSFQDEGMATHVTTSRPIGLLTLPFVGPIELVQKRQVGAGQPVQLLCAVWCLILNRRHGT